jgi:16S rRNA (cytidine1402-2'-O)-methyltransferase
VTATGTLWLVATPIGNLADLAPRAVEVLRRAQLVCCEDTRRTGRLLQHAGVRAERLAVVNEHTELARVLDVLDVLAGGGEVAVVTDAGTPGISDPGERLVAAVLDAGFEVSAVPGPAALVMALTISGLPTGRFVFDGFLPRSGRDRRERLVELATETRTIVLYEAPHRVARTIEDLREAFGGERRVAVCRELTKMFESVARGTLDSVEIGEPRGEYVIVLAGRSGTAQAVDDDTIRAELRAALAAGSTKRDAVDDVSRRLGASRNTVYALAVALS